MSSYDCVVIGLGAMGSAALRELALRGHAVLGIDAFHPPHDRGSSHGESRIIRKAYFEDPAYVPLVLRSYEAWAALERVSGKTLLHRCGGLFAGFPESEVVQGSLASARDHELPHELLETADIRNRYPQFSPPDGVVAVYELDAGFLRVESCIEAMLDQAVRHGAEALFHHRLSRWERHGDLFHLTVGDRRIETPNLLVSAGAWLGKLLPDMTRQVKVQQVVTAWFPTAGERESFQVDRFPVHIWDLDDGALCYGMPRVPGGRPGIKLGFHGHRATVDPDHRPDTAANTARELGRYGRKLIPALIPEAVDATTCMYTTTADHHFIVGPHPERPGVWLAGGFSGHGFKFAPVIGAIAADLVTSGTTAHPIAPFSPSRRDLSA
ncbi:N-methyl-L-tryptophan oxidase [Sulfidibacter corallicola]|uniref:N-methyl-L-tryptophan oxidase n=1 Tax=Sulfidibacter corallicola TaxID=2818388 RepID=A0A8A4TNQ3_SULCO|nr:N-methyl-L-tryptophan oxidase [Sulfidibacter corallicola]QTD50834.1 N-methyl-L-tryptophan oxidase [Sulfidibacter corallicola]